MKGKHQILLLFAFLLMACSSTLPKDSMPPVNVQPQNMNTMLHLSSGTEQKAFNANKDVNLTVENISHISVAFPVDCNIKIFTYTNGSWVEVKNKVQYSWLKKDANGVLVPSLSDEYRILPPKMESNENWAETEMGCGFLPDVAQYDLPIMLRAIVIGNVVQDEKVTDEKVGAYVDVLMK